MSAGKGGVTTCATVNALLSNDGAASRPMRRSPPFSEGHTLGMLTLSALWLKLLESFSIAWLGGSLRGVGGPTYIGG